MSKIKPSKSCGHMPFSEIQFEDLQKACYQNKKGEVRSLLKKYSEKLGLDNLEDMPENFLSQLHLTWTDADMSGVSWHSLSYLYIPAIKFFQEHKDDWDIRNIKRPKEEKTNNQGTFFLVSAAKKNSTSINPWCLFRLHQDVNGQVEIQDKDLFLTESVVNDVLSHHNSLRNFLTSPHAYLTKFNFERLVEKAIELHPTWYLSLLKIVTDKEKSVDSFRNKIEGERGYYPHSQFQFLLDSITKLCEHQKRITEFVLNTEERTKNYNVEITYSASAVTSLDALNIDHASEKAMDVFQHPNAKIKSIEISSWDKKEQKRFEV